MIRNMLRNMVNERAEELLCAIGLERRRGAFDHVFTATTYFVAGAIVGGCAALLLAPTSGLALRNRLTEQLRAAGERARRAADEVRGRAVQHGASNYDDTATAS